MNPEELDDLAQEQPVAYDTQGHPLYAHPAQIARPEAMVASQAVHMASPAPSARPFISDATKVKHDRSRQLYPTLTLNDSEYVVTAVRRHPIGLFVSFAIGLLFATIALSALFNYDIVVKVLQLKGASADIGTMALPIIALVLLICLLTYIAYYVYNNNRFYLTNESIVEQTQAGLFSHAEKSVDLLSVEDIRYTQTNMLQNIVGYGTIEISTIGEEEACRFTYVANPQDYVTTLNDAVEAAKNGHSLTL